MRVFVLPESRSTVKALCGKVDWICDAVAYTIGATSVTTQVTDSSVVKILGFVDDGSANFTLFDWLVCGSATAIVLDNCPWNSVLGRLIYCLTGSLNLTLLLFFNCPRVVTRLSTVGLSPSSDAVRLLCWTDLSVAATGLDMKLSVSPLSDCQCYPWLE